MNLKKLQQDRIDAAARAAAIIAVANAANRAMTADEVVLFNAEKATVANLDANIAIAKEALEAERASTAIVAAAGAQAGADRATEKPWDSLGQQLLAVRDYQQSKGHTRDPRLFAALGQNETVDAEGGFLVAPEFSKELLTRAFESGIVTSRCRTVPMASSRLVLNGIDDSSRLPGFRYGGISVYRVAEAANFTASKMKFRRVELNANKLIGLFYATDELLDDAAALESQVSDYFPEAFGWQLDNEVINGTGAGQFLGIMTSGAAVVVPKVTGQATQTVVSQNFLSMNSALWLRSRPNAVWFVGPDVEQYLYQLTIPGTTGTAPAMYTPPGINGNNSKYGMLLGRPVIPIEQTAAFSSQGDIILADLSQYIIGERSGIKFATSIHVAFNTDEQAFRWTLRNDGQPLWDKPLTQANSSTKVSPFVVLGAR